MSSVETEASEATETTEAPPTDDLRAGILAAFESELADGIADSHLAPGENLWIRVKAEAWQTTADVAKHKLAFTFFDFLSAIDWMPSPFGRYEDAEVDTPLAEKLGQPWDLQTGTAGGETRFQLLARVADVRNRHVGVLLKSDVPESLTMPTWTGVYSGADWHERETWEMYGISFEGHPDLKHIYLPSDFEGFPLRKDFPLLPRIVKPWPGIVDVEPMPGEEPGEGDDAAEGEASE
ncbi:MAG TPA: NADH-quinone oxidoreductase subunit C [Acidimicrobiales bacterium]|nr:NADH-quinone oxidoreductase subunit C [Acidimicrobiales bacterium]